MSEAEFKSRTMEFALRVIRLVSALPRNRSADVIGRQLLRSATSIGANYRAACRARSKAEFRSKLAIAEEEADESLYWLELVIESGLVPSNRLADLIKECEELLAMLVASIKTTRAREGRNRANPKPKIQNPKSGV